MMNPGICRETQSQMFPLVSGSHISTPHRDSNMASLYKALKIWVRHFPNISHMKYCTGLIFDKAFCLLIFFYFPDSELSVLNGLHFYFLRKQRIHYHTCTSTNMSAKLIMGTTKGCPTALGYWIDLSLYTSII